MKNVNSKAGWIIAILVLINIATLVTIWVGFREHRPIQNGHDTAHFLIKELGFDSLQKEKYLLLVKQHQQDIQDIKEQAKESKEAFFFLLADTTISEDNIKARARTAFESEGEIAIKTFHHLQQVRALCTAEQKHKFDRIIKDVIRMMGRQAGGPPPPHPDRLGGDGDKDQHLPPRDDGFPPPPDDNRSPR